MHTDSSMLRVKSPSPIKRKIKIHRALFIRALLKDFFEAIEYESTTDIKSYSVFIQWMGGPHGEIFEIITYRLCSAMTLRNDREPNIFQSDPTKLSQ